VLGDLEGSVLGIDDGIELGFELGDLKGSLLGEDDGIKLG